MRNLLEIVPDRSAHLVYRENRFLAVVRNGEEFRVHVHDPGRLEELLFPGNEVLIKRAEGKKRKTSWDLIAAKYRGNWVLVHSGYHRKIAENILSFILPNYTLQAEVNIGDSRIDFMARHDEEVVAVEVKGCTLARNGVALFPDAPTSRGARHVRELTKFAGDGKDAMLLILVFREDARCFLPNEDRDPKFAEVFWKAVDAGVKVLPALLKYDGRYVWHLGEIPICHH